MQEISKEDKKKKEFVWIERISWALDNKFKIPGIPFRFGLDPLLNFIPFIGKLFSFGISALMVIVMYRNGVSRRTVILMMINLLIDVVLGSIPLFGYAFDFFHKANQKNIALLRAHYFENKHQGKGNDLIALILFILIAITILICYLLWQLSVWLWGLLF